MKVLCVAEKPSIAKSITQILSGGQFQPRDSPVRFIKNYEFQYPQTNSFFTVTAVAGHLMSNDFDAMYRRWQDHDPFVLFDAPTRELVADDKKGIALNLERQARNADVLMIWTDCDREGEHIGREIARVCQKAKRNITIRRARFSAIIAQQIHNAAQHPIALDERQADAVEARIVLDLKVGAAFTRHQTMSLQSRIQELAVDKSVLSYGPCQFPTLGFVVKRFNSVIAFLPESFWYIYLALSRPNVSQGDMEETKFNWKRGHLFDHQAVMNLFSEVQENPTARVEKVTNKATKKWKPLPLTTVELQKAGSRLLRMAPKRVLDIAEGLYQEGYISYPRTETDQFDPQFDFASLITKQTASPQWGEFATGLQQGGFNPPRRGKNDDKAHPPIHPTNYAGNLPEDKRKVYEYITRRFLACCSKDAEGWQTTVDVVCGGEQFSAVGLVVRERNYLIVYPYDKWSGHYVPDFQEGEEFNPSACEVQSGETTSPNYLTEADLVTLMDKNGIGTDATIAQHIQTIVDREYVKEHMEGGTKYLVPSKLGLGLIEGYDEIGLVKSVSKPNLRRETERDMVRVCQGTLSKHDMIEQSLEKYKQMFITVKRDFNKVVESVRRNLSAPVEPFNRGGGGGGGGSFNGGGGGGGDGPDDADGRPPPTRGRGRGRGASTRARGTTTKPRGAAATRGRRSKAQTLEVTEVAPASVYIPPQPPQPMSSTSRLPPPPPPSPPLVVPSFVDPDDEEDSWLVPEGGRSAPSGGMASASSSSTSRTATSSTVSGSTNTTLASTYNPTPDGPVVYCLCRPPQRAIMKEVIKESSNKGKWFWSCVERACTFFDWVNGPQTTGTRPEVSISAGKKRAALDSEPTGSARRCLCGLDGVLLTSNKEGPNQGRKFWKCPKKEEEGRCKFFEWDDEPAKAGGGASSSSGQGECFNCGKTGHWSNACPNPSNSNKRAKTSDPKASYRTDATCHTCGGKGHWANSCPKPMSAGSSTNRGRGRGRGGSSRGKRGAGRGRKKTFDD